MDAPDVFECVPPTAWLPFLTRAKDAFSRHAAHEGLHMFRSLLDVGAPTLALARVLKAVGVSEFAPSAM